MSHHSFRADQTVCTAEVHPSDLVEAHRLMQVHRACPRSCPSRSAALAMLVAAGHYRLSTRFGPHDDTQVAS
jgi:hypothetical protein